MKDSCSSRSVVTVEGNLAGERAGALERERKRIVSESEAQRTELRKRTDEATDAQKLRNFKGRFKVQEPQNVKESRVYGLKTRDEWNQAQKGAKKRSGLYPYGDSSDEEGEPGDTANRREKQSKKKAKLKTKRHKEIRALLSFVEDDEQSGTNDLDSELLIKSKRKTKLKNPAVDTSFLPDREREEIEREKAKELKKARLLEIERVKEESIVVVYSYWDGIGHRREISVKKGNTVEQFLEQVRLSLVKEFTHLRSASPDTLMYIKEDLIIPNEVTFYDLIVSKARGKTGPLFSFDVHDDVRLVGDIRIQSDNSHAGKVVERHWFERNRHIYPASNWDLLDMNAITATQE